MHHKRKKAPRASISLALILSSLIVGLAAVPATASAASASLEQAVERAEVAAAAASADDAGSIAEAREQIGLAFELAVAEYAQSQDPVLAALFTQLDTYEAAVDMLAPPDPTWLATPGETSGLMPDLGYGCGLTVTGSQKHGYGYNHSYVIKNCHSYPVNRKIDVAHGNDGRCHYAIPPYGGYAHGVVWVPSWGYIRELKRC